MRIGILTFRLGGLDGVALEAENWRRVLTRMGHDAILIAGEFKGTARGVDIPLLHFHHPEIERLTADIFDKNIPREKFQPTVEHFTREIVYQLENAVKGEKLDLLIVKNVFCLPVNLPGALAVKEVVKKLNIPTIARHHDFFWERSRFNRPDLQEKLLALFSKEANIKHLTCSLITQKQFKEKTGLDSTIIHDSFDFETLPAKRDEFNQDFKKRLNLDPNRKIILQATRIVPRKKIERTVELASHLKTPVAVLFTNHYANDEPGKYFTEIQKLIKTKGVDAVFAQNHIAPTRSQGLLQKKYSFWDAYLFADLFAYPTEVEGFGNQFLEAVAFKLPIFVNRYAVYKSDIEPLGFEIVTINGVVTDEASARVDRILSGEEGTSLMIEKNFEIGRKHFSFEALDKKLSRLISERFLVGKRPLYSFPKIKPFPISLLS